jgi:hypothetical protein
MRYAVLTHLTYCSLTSALQQFMSDDRLKIIMAPDLALRLIHAAMAFRYTILSAAF